MAEMPVRELKAASLDEELVAQYLSYLDIRIRFLLNRYRRFPDFPGVQSGYNSITGEEFRQEDLYPYSWINGRGVCVFSRFAELFPAYSVELHAFARHVISAMENQWLINGRHFPFMANLDGSEKDVGVKPPPGYKSYSDLYACAGFLEYGARCKDKKRLEMAQEIFAETILALERRHFVTEPQPTPEDRILENPWSVALDLANEMVKHTGDEQYLDAGARLVEHLLKHYYLPDLAAFVEYITPEGQPFVDEEGRQIVDPGHAIEFCSFALEFARLADEGKKHGKLKARIFELIPKLILWNLERGWNKTHGGIFKTIDARTGQPVNDTMPWWIPPETLLALVLAYERTRDRVFLMHFQRVHNAYFQLYMNPLTDYGPYQNISGSTGIPVDIVPACKFQDPEFHSGKNLLTVTEVVRRAQAC
jgi:mannose/cellobiose epimerase-like protein (N-acyl-D-glucosamine 2-epimerase family)